MRLGFALLVASLTTASAASASPIYPGIVKTTVGGASAPRCTVCHETPNGGLGTATKPLAAYLRSRGLVANDEGALMNALAAAEGEMHDADGDGVTDIVELKNGTDPNGVETSAPPAPEYGCGNVSGSRPSLLGLLLLAVILRRRR